MPNNSLALMIRSPEIDLGGSLAKASQAQHSFTQNALAQFNMRQRQEQDAAMRMYAEGKQSGDPNAASGLLRYPDLHRDVLANDSTAEASRRERLARAAQRVLHEADPARKQMAYIQEIDALHANRDLPGLMHQNLRQRPPDDEMLKGIIAQAMPLQASEAPKFQKTGEEVDKYGSKRDLYGFVDPLRQTVSPPRNLAPPTGGGHAGPSLTDLTGKALLDALDPGDRSQVQAILEGRQAPPSPNARNARTQKIMEWVAQADPTFDMTVWKTRNETQAAYSKGPEGRNITALNTLPRHLQELYTAADDLKNSNLWGTNLARHITNPIAGLSSDVEARFKRFENAKQAVAEELGKAFHGAAAVSATEGWKGQFDATSSDKALKASILEAIKLATGRNEELEASYTRAMGHAPKQAFVSPSARKAFEEVTAKVKGQKTKTGDDPPERLPRITGRTQAERDAQYDALNEGESFIDPTGKKRTKPVTSTKQPDRLGQ